MTMKIFYLNGRYPFCYYYRGYLPAVYSGQKCVSDYLKTDKIDLKKVQEGMEEADVVVMQRPQDINSLRLLRTLKTKGKKVIFENDDTYLVGKGILLERLENDKQRKVAVGLSEMTNQILKEADGAIASTETLAKEYRAINPNVLVVKNCIDPFDGYIRKSSAGKFRIGLVGSVTTNDDYLHIKEDLKKLDARDDVTIVVFGIKYKDGSSLNFMREDKKFWESLKNVEWQPYVPILEYMYTLHKLNLDLAIIPRQSSYFNQCKSNLKFLEMSLLTVPVLAQDFPGSPYSQDKDYLTLVPLGGEWYTRITRIIEEYPSYLAKAERAKEYVLQNYNIKVHANVWTETIKKLCKSPQSI